MSSSKKPSGKSSGARSSGAGRGAGPQRPARPASAPSRPAGARSTAGARPRIRASHAEGGGVEGLSDNEVERRRARAKASVRALDRRPAAKRQLPPPPPKRESVGPRLAKRKSAAPQSSASAAAQELALALAAAGLDKKAVGIEVIDVSGRVDYADYLVIMTGTSDRHVHAIAMGLEDALKRKKIVPLSVEGLASASWVLMDFSDVVVHVFQEETRRIYDIEGLWMDASRLDVPGPSAT